MMREPRPEFVDNEPKMSGDEERSVNIRAGRVLKAAEELQEGLERLYAALTGESTMNEGDEGIPMDDMTILSRLNHTLDRLKGCGDMVGDISMHLYGHRGGML